MRCRLVDTVAEGDKEDWREDDEKPGSLLKGVECGEGSVEVDEVVFGKGEMHGLADLNSQQSSSFGEGNLPFLNRWIHLKQTSKQRDLQGKIGGNSM